MPIPAAVHAVAWLALGSAATVVYVQNRDLRERLDRVETERAEAPARGDAVPGAGLLAGRESVEAKSRAEEALRRVDAVSVDAKKLRADHDRFVATVMAMPEGSKAVESSTTFVEKPGFEDAVRGVVDRYATEQKFRDTMKKAAGPIVPKKPQYKELAKALELDDRQSTRFEQDIRGIQTELYEILQMPRDDGAVPLEEIMQAEQYPEGSPKKAEAFLKLFKLTIPGTQETYIERAMALVGRVRTSSNAYLHDAQREKLDTIDLDWFGIKMPQ